jgi:hypothetical protein
MYKGVSYMKGIQLVYFCLIDSDTELNNMELTFSNELEFHLQEYDSENSKYNVFISKKLKVDNISEEFWGEEKHVSRVDLLVGENGAGKSTIMRCLADQEKAVCFAIYLEVINGKFNWYVNKNINYSFDVELVEEWNIKNTINPKEIQDSPFASRYITNIFKKDWVSEYNSIGDSSIILANKTLSIYDFVTHKLQLLQDYFSAENLVYQFTIPFNTFLQDMFILDTQANNNLKSLLKTAIFMIHENSEIQLKFKEKLDYCEMGEEYYEYRKNADALLVQCFDFTDEELMKKTNLLKMIIYIHWIMCIITYYEELRDSAYDGYFNTLSEFNNYLKDALNNCVSKSKHANGKIGIIKKYMKFDFIEKLFSLVEHGWVNIRIPSTGSIEFNIVMNKKVDKKAEVEIIDLISFIDEIKRSNLYGKRNDLIVQWVGYNNLSSGEMAYIELFSSIYEVLFLKEATKDDKFEFEMYNNATNYLFLLDEPDAGFHPEWSRNLIYNVTTFINKLLIETNKKCQIIISTHSPFMVSDMPPEYVTCIELKVGKNGKYYRTIKKPTHSFAANIYELLNDGFFMNAPIGEFAQHKIQKVISRINVLDNIQGECLTYEIENISIIINMVSDKLIRGRLNDMLEKKKKIQLDAKSTNLLEYLSMEIKELKREILELKNKENNGEKL